MVTLRREMGRIAGIRPHPAHPYADFLDIGFLDRFGRRQATLGDDRQAIAHFEQLVELFRQHEYRHPLVAQVDDLLPNESGRADVDAPRGLRDDEHLGLLHDFAADDELLQVAAREALGFRLRAAAFDVEVVYARSGEGRDRRELDQAGFDEATAVGGQQGVVRKRHARYRTAAEA